MFRVMFFPRKLSTWLDRVLPRSLSIRLHRLYTPYHNWLVGRHSRRLIHQLFPEGDLFVRSGPFRGMKYLPLSSGSALVPKLLGVYEQELHGAFSRLLQRDYRTVIDIGCAEGYYLVGLALQLPRSALLGFDLNPRALAACRRLAEANGVAGRIRLQGRCCAESLAPVVGPRTLIVCDCEGAEVELLDPIRAQGLRQADLVVELHDWLVPGASSLIQERFGPTHCVQVISSAERDPQVLSQWATLGDEDQRLALDEFRPGPMEWMVMEARS